MRTPPDVDHGDVTPEQSGSGLTSDLLTRLAVPAPPSYLQLDDSDSDSAYGKDSILLNETKSLSEYITAYRFEFGRRYHSFRDGAYWVRGVPSSEPRARFLTDRYRDPMMTARMSNRTSLIICI
jgi:hypothetical protein